MKSTDIHIRPGVAEDWEAISELIRNVFHEPADDEVSALEASTFEPERSLVADDAASSQATRPPSPRELSIPGAVVPAAFVSLVGVAPPTAGRAC